MDINEQDVHPDNDFTSGFMNTEEGLPVEEEQAPTTEAEVIEEEIVVEDQPEVTHPEDEEEIIEDEVDELVEDEDEPESMEEIKKKYETALNDARRTQSRLDNLAEQYRSTRDQLHNLEYEMRNSDKKEEEVVTKDEPVELPESFKELKDYAPDFAQALEDMLNARLGSTQKQIDEAISKKVNPLSQQLKEINTDTHMSRIQAVHPDAREISNSDEFYSWIDGLSAWERRSANQVIESGTSSEVVELLTYYKEDTGLSEPRKTKTSKKGTSTKRARKSGTAVDEDTLKRIRNGQAVRSSRTTPDIRVDDGDPDPDDFDAGFNEGLSK